MGGNRTTAERKKSVAADRHRRKASGSGQAPRELPRSEEIADAISADIVAGELMPGAHLNEQLLAERFGVSRTPVREAIRRLVAQHLVEIRPRRGAFVAELQLNELIQMFEFMSELEGICARLCARRMSGEEKAHLAQVHREYQRHVDGADHSVYFEASNQFHHLIYAGAKNESLQKTTDQMYQRLAPYRRRQLDLIGRSGNSFDEHQIVLDAILAGDGEAAEAAMRGHTGVVIDNVMALIASMQSEAQAR